MFLEPVDRDGGADGADDEAERERHQRKTIAMTVIANPAISSVATIAPMMKECQSVPTIGRSGGSGRGGGALLAITALPRRRARAG
jgi:hypothetical protein